MAVLQMSKVLQAPPDHPETVGSQRCKTYAQNHIVMQYVLQWHRPRESDMKFGYARVSTADQHLDMQLQALRLAGCTRIFQEQRSGAHRDRPELLRLLDQLREGDTVVVWRLDRLARSTRDLLDIVACLQERGAGFQSLAEPWADTTSAAGRMVMTVFAGIAEFERDLIRERTGTGRVAAKQRGVRFGRPPKLNADQQALVQRLLAEGRSVAEVARAFRVHPVTIYRLPAAGPLPAEPSAPQIEE
jgi:DNA invertase Pin-like site-specific DNA recombinase